MKQIGLESKQAELAELVLKWAKKTKLLRPGEIINVTIEISTPPPVTVKIEGYSGPTDIGLVRFSDLELSVRAENVLLNAGIVVVNDIRGKTLAELQKIKNMGNKSIREIQEALLKLGVEVKWFPTS